jgi:hypothetical protein
LTRRLATAWRLEAEWRAADRIKGAADAAARAIELGDRLYREAGATDAEIGELARANIVAGEIAFSAGDPATARRHGQRAAGMLAPRVSNTRDWRLLDPAARVAASTGRSDEAHALIARLTALGYTPLTPWPASTTSNASTPSLPPVPQSK